MTEYVKARLTTKFGKWYPFIRFDYALSWNAEYRSGFAAFCVAVMTDNENGMFFVYFSWLQ